MGADEPNSSVRQSESSDGVVDRVERGILSRRSFLAGLGVGSIGGGAAVALARTDADFQSLATLAGGAVGPAKTRYHLPAVDSSGAGLIVAADFEFADGAGELFVDLDGLEVRHDLQLALREAAQTATRIAGKSLAGTAVYVTFSTPDTDVFALRGKSWETGLTVALVAALRRQALDSDTLVTGVVDDDGALLPVGGITAKAQAARAFGSSELIVPENDETSSSVEGIRITGMESISEALDRIL
jgi:predicted S18 family serine protease